jgi:predicted transcriptional regulator
MAVRSKFTVKSVMSNYIIDIEEDQSLSLMINLFEKGHISGAPVIDQEGRYVGVISKTDVMGHKLVEALKANLSLSDLKVKDFMNPSQMKTINENSPVDLAVEEMLAHKVHRLFVTDDQGKLVGVVSSFDMLKLIQLEHQPSPQGSSGFQFWK